MLERVCICCMHQCFQAERGEVGHTDLAQVGNTDLAPPFVCRRYTFAPASFWGLSAVAGFCGFRPDADHVPALPSFSYMPLGVFITEHELKQTTVLRYPNSALCERLHVLATVVAPGRGREIASKGNDQARQTHGLLAPQDASTALGHSCCARHAGSPAHCHAPLSTIQPLPPCVECAGRQSLVGLIQLQGSIKLGRGDTAHMAPGSAPDAALAAWPQGQN